MSRSLTRNAVLKELAGVGDKLAAKALTNPQRLALLAEGFHDFLPALDVLQELFHFAPGIAEGVGGAAQREKVERKLDQVREMGATVLCGAKRPARLTRGYYFEPTVVVDVDHSMPLMREETFGPVAPIMKVKDIDEASRKKSEDRMALYRKRQPLRE